MRGKPTFFFFTNRNVKQYKLWPFLSVCCFIYLHRRSVGIMYELHSIYTTVQGFLYYRYVWICVCVQVCVRMQVLVYKLQPAFDSSFFFPLNFYARWESLRCHLCTFRQQKNHTHTHTVHCFFSTLPLLLVCHQLSTYHCGWVHLRGGSLCVWVSTSHPRCSTALPETAVTPNKLSHFPTSLSLSDLKWTTAPGWMTDGAVNKCGTSWTSATFKQKHCRPAMESQFLAHIYWRLPMLLQLQWFMAII